ncbi:hypothetical protein [Streptomyces sp. NL15-2K]|uniref:hypothetical protein n=1 Tax=Streptomyces sp. NL15-2K TaxID=376149 RepID=UPI000F56255C|nr:MULTISPECIES: hypothetical protein [Actinomycetes]WKX07275.1 hypothetical protein Q4V64_07180 [Kutzneria buriramensis]
MPGHSAIESPHPGLTGAGHLVIATPRIGYEYDGILGELDTYGCRSWLWHKQAQRITTSRTALQTVLKLLTKRYPAVELRRGFRVAEKCTARCRAAKGHECACSCLAEHHGAEAPDRGWKRGWTMNGFTHVHENGQDWGIVTVEPAPLSRPRPSI